MKLAILTTHPIQYYAPLFQLLAGREGLDIRVFYTWGEGCLQDKYDPGFGKTIEWDIPLLEGYPYQFVKNASKKPGSSHFRGIINPNLIRDVEQWGAGAILVFGWSYHSHLQAMRHFKGKIPVIFRGDSHLLDEQGGVKLLLRRNFLKWVYRHIDYAWYVGSQNRAYYLKHGLKPSQLRWVPHAIDNSRFADPTGELQQEADTWKAQLGISEGQLTVLFAGKFEPKKNPAILIEAAKRLDAQKFAWVLVGNGVLEETLRQKAAGLKNVHFLPFQNQSKMPVLYRLGHVYALPSNGPGETWGLAVNEAMASGRPVVVSDQVGCAVDLAKEGESGKIFPAGDVEAFCAAVRHVAEEGLHRANSSESIIKDWHIARAASLVKECLVRL